VWKGADFVIGTPEASPGIGTKVFPPTGAESHSTFPAVSLNAAAVKIALVRTTATSFSG